MRKNTNKNFRKNFSRHSAAALIFALAMLNSNAVIVNAAQDCGAGQIMTEAGEMGGSALTGLTDSQIISFYDNSVFVGDSIMLGFRNYSMKRQDDAFLSNLKFLAAGSFSVNNSFWDPSNKNSVHPIYQGERRYVWDSISMMGSKRVFIKLGMNDLNISGVEGTCNKYKELIGKIRESNPDSEIYVMGMTYVVCGQEKGKLQNDTIREFNSALETLAAENGCGYLNIADALADENGGLAQEYCSDGFAHQNASAYEVWERLLKDFAAQQLTAKEEAADEIK